MVGEHEIERLVAMEGGDGGGAVSGLDHLVAIPAQASNQESADETVVLGDQNASHGRVLPGDGFLASYDGDGGRRLRVGGDRKSGRVPGVDRMTGARAWLEHELRRCPGVLARGRAVSSPALFGYGTADIPSWETVSSEARA
jgi:hypothetical protein